MPITFAYCGWPARRATAIFRIYKIALKTFSQLALTEKPSQYAMAHKWLLWPAFNILSIGCFCFVVTQAWKPHRNINSIFLHAGATANNISIWYELNTQRTHTQNTTTRRHAHSVEFWVKLSCEFMCARTCDCLCAYLFFFCFFDGNVNGHFVSAGVHIFKGNVLLC